MPAYNISSVRSRNKTFSVQAIFLLFQAYSDFKHYHGARPNEITLHIATDDSLASRGIKEIMCKRATIIRV
jgi:hypothetical protein